MSRAAVVAAAADAFVRRELRAELEAALRRGFAEAGGADGAERLDAALGALLQQWSPQLPAPARADGAAGRAERIVAAVAALNSEERWGAVEGWVRLHVVRMQGRTRLPLQQLMGRESVKIARYGLTEAEVLALHLYTGVRPHSQALARASSVG